MRGLEYTLLADGSSDRVLLRVVSWLLHSFGVHIERASFADLSLVSPRPRSLDERVRAAVLYYPCQLLFVHRDAESSSVDRRYDEIEAATMATPHVPIVPVRMTEAWLLHDAAAIRSASGNPNGTAELGIPPVGRLEAISDPKQVLFDSLMRASESKNRRLRGKLKKDLPRMRLRVAELIDDFMPLYRLPAFSRFVERLKDALEALGYSIR